MARQLYQPAMAFGPHNKVGVAHTISGPNKGAATLIRRSTFSCTELQRHVVRVRERRSPDYACPYNEREVIQARRCDLEPGALGPVPGDGRHVRPTQPEDWSCGGEICARERAHDRRC